MASKSKNVLNLGKNKSKNSNKDEQKKNFEPFRMFVGIKMEKTVL